MIEKTDIGQQLIFLLKLQDVDAQVYKLIAEKEAKPEEAQQFKDSLAAKQAALEEAKENHKNIQLKRKENEVELGTKEGEIKKLETQLYQIKTNKEYTAMLHEIERKKADNSLLEEEILKLMEAVDATAAKIQEEKKKFEDISKDVDVEIKKIETRVKEIDSMLAELKKKREEIEPTINPKILKNYEKILNGKDGLALVEVVNDACGGCHMNLPPQVINEVRMLDHIIQCGSCQRMLYMKYEPF